MNDSAESRAPAATEYAERQKARQDVAARLHRRHLALSNARLVSFLTAARISRESVGLWPLSTRTTPSLVTMIPQLELPSRAVWT